MRAQAKSGPAYLEIDHLAPFDSFAYRLAHLALPRPLMLAAIAALFYLV